MCGGNIEILPELEIGDYVVDILWQTFAEIVIHFVVRFVVSVIGGGDQYGKYDKENRKNLYDTFCKLAHIRDQRAMLCLLKRLIQNEDQ